MRLRCTMYDGVYEDGVNLHDERWRCKSWPLMLIDLKLCSHSPQSSSLIKQCCTLQLIITVGCIKIHNGIEQVGCRSFVLPIWCVPADPLNTALGWHWSWGSRVLAYHPQTLKLFIGTTATNMLPIWSQIKWSHHLFLITVTRSGVNEANVLNHFQSGLEDLKQATCFSWGKIRNKWSLDLNAP